MSVIASLRRIAQHEERIARLELAQAERVRQDQEQAVHHAAQAVGGALALGEQAPLEAFDHYHRHGYALRMEMQRRGAERRLIEQERVVGTRREAIAAAARARGTLDRLVERHEEAEATERRRIEQGQLDETGLQGWWRGE